MSGRVDLSKAFACLHSDDASSEQNLLQLLALAEQRAQKLGNARSAAAQRGGGAAQLKHSLKQPPKRPGVSGVTDGAAKRLKPSSATSSSGSGAGSLMPLGGGPRGRPSLVKVRKR